MNRFLFSVAVASIALSSCTTIGVRTLSKRAVLPPSQIEKNIPYVEGDDSRHQLDLYLPKGQGFPVLVFVHGGGWTTGDKSLKVGGLDVYGNIGRYFASQGIATAVINYRLIPDVSWREQAIDVDSAVGWVRANIAEYGGASEKIFLGGHSAGAQLAAHAALGAEPDTIRGVILISGAGLDLNDRETYKLGAKEEYYEKRFAAEGDWRTAASPATQITAEAPPFLIFYATGESKALQHQATIFAQTLHTHDVDAKLVAVPGESHERMVLVASHPEKNLTQEALIFIKELSK